MKEVDLNKSKMSLRPLDAIYFDSVFATYLRAK